MSKTLFAFCLLSLLYSCATVKRQADVMGNLERIPAGNEQIETIEFRARLTAQFGSETNVVNSKVCLSGKDSVSMTLTGPLGVALGKLYADSTEFYFFNVFENVIIAGAPSEENFRKAVNLNISFTDFAQIARCLPPGEISDYNLHSQDTSDNNTALFRRIVNESIVDFALVSLIDGSLTQFQRKSLSGEIIINTFFRDYILVQGYLLAGKIVMQFPSASASLTIEGSSHKINEKLPLLRFQTPEGIKRIILN